MNQLTQYAQICLCALPIWLILRRPWKRPLPREFALCAFVLLMTALLTMVLEGAWAPPAQMLSSARERIASGHKIHLIPFTTIGPQLRALPDESALVQLVGNTVLFMPWGFFLPLLWQRFRNPVVLTVAALLLTLFIETTQLFIDRFVEVDDLILNFTGSMVGSGLWWWLHRFVPLADQLAA